MHPRLLNICMRLVSDGGICFMYTWKQPPTSTLWIPKGLAQPPPHLSALTENAFNNISTLCQQKKNIYIYHHIPVSEPIHYNPGSANVFLLTLSLYPCLWRPYSTLAKAYTPIWHHFLLKIFPMVQNEKKTTLPSGFTIVTFSQTSGRKKRCCVFNENKVRLALECWAITASFAWSTDQSVMINIMLMLKKVNTAKCCDRTIIFYFFFFVAAGGKFFYL